MHVTKLLAQTTEQECLTSFDESKFFEGFGERRLLGEIKDKFFNISRVFDCIGCDKCRFNGKVQITGLGAAMKVLFQQNPEEKLVDLELIGIL